MTATGVVNARPPGALPKTTRINDSERNPTLITFPPGKIPGDWRPESGIDAKSRVYAKSRSLALQGGFIYIELAYRQSEQEQRAGQSRSRRRERWRVCLRRPPPWVAVVGDCPS